VDELLDVHLHVIDGLFVVDARGDHSNDERKASRVIAFY
jgi:hypothetical protein